jgi:hypothetical protein
MGVAKDLFTARVASGVGGAGSQSRRRVKSQRPEVYSGKITRGVEECSSGQRERSLRLRGRIIGGIAWTRFQWAGR